MSDNLQRANERMTDFTSKIEELKAAEELNMDPTPGFGKYKPFLKSAAAHPAKANTTMIEYLVTRFTREGDTLLDPMSGSGSTRAPCI